MVLFLYQDGKQQVFLKKGENTKYLGKKSQVEDI